jgi:hypothetical protein
MKPYKLLILSLFLTSIMLLVNGCVSSSKTVNRQLVTDDGGKKYSNVDLSVERIAQIRNAFIGRSFILKEDWYEYGIIDSDPLGGFSDPVPITTFPNWYLNKGAQKIKLASKGSAAKINGMRTYWNGMTFICNMETGEKIYLTIINHRPWTLFLGQRHTGKSVSRDKLKDERITVAWVERNLTYHTVEFVKDLPKVQDSDIAMPKPTQQPTLTPVTTGGTGMTSEISPSVKQLNITADPAQVKNSEDLNLLLDYSIDAAGQDSVTVIETRTLLLDGKVLPNYPKTNKLSRSSGHYTTSFKQMIPPRARAGNYIYKGEVCVENGCISKISKFQVVK